MSPWYERYFTADYWVYADAEYTPERTTAEVDFLASVLTELAPGRRVLDVGCGTGRHAVELARRGFEVTGVDVSRYALERAREAAEAAGVDVRFGRLDALAAAPSQWPVREVDAVVCLQAFGWGSDADQLRMLRTLRRLLVPLGVIVLDHSNVTAILRRYASRSTASVAGHTFEFERSYDPLTGRSGGVVRVRRPDGSTAELPDDVRLYQPSEVAALLARAGFRPDGVHADFRAGTPVGMDTRYVQFVAQAVPWQVSALAGHRAPVAAGHLDLRWAPDEIDFVDGPLRRAWESVSGPGVCDRLRRYDVADPYAAERSTATLAEHFAVELRPEQVCAGAGATGLLRSLAGLATGDRVLMDGTGHPELALAAEELGATAWPLLSFHDPGPHDLGTVRGARPAVLVMDRPGVAGHVVALERVRRMAEAVAEHAAVLVVDETCASYLPPAESAVALAATGTPALVVLRSMSKGYCCGGLRVGFAVSSPDVAERVRAVCAPLAVGALALDVALALLRQGDVLAGLRARITEVKPGFVERFAAVGCATSVGDPRLPWVLAIDPGGRLAEFGIAGKPVHTTLREPGLVRLSVPLSPQRWQAVDAALGSGLGRSGRHGEAPR